MDSAYVKRLLDVMTSNLGAAPSISQHTVAINPAAVVASTNSYHDAGR